MNLSLRRLFGFTTEVPPEHRKNFNHLYWDVAFWGLLNGSVVNFLGVYCSRIGATPLQMGLLTAIPALMNLIVTLPATIWLRNIPSTRVVPVAALITRLFYGLLIPLPMLLPPETRIWVILGIVLFQNITGAIAATIGNAFLAETIPVEWRGQVVGNRNALIAVTSMLTSLAVGQILNNMSFAAGYQVIFAIGFAGSLASAYHLFQVKPVLSPPAIPTLEGEIAPAPAAGARPEILRGPFRKLLIMMFLLNIAVFMLSPIFPLYQVNVLHLTDQTISLAAALFGLVQFIVSTQGGAISRRLGFRQMTGLGMTVASFSTLMFTFSFQPGDLFLDSNRRRHRLGDLWRRGGQLPARECARPRPLGAFSLVQPDDQRGRAAVRAVCFIPGGRAGPVRRDAAGDWDPVPGGVGRDEVWIREGGLFWSLSSVQRRAPLRRRTDDIISA